MKIIMNEKPDGTYKADKQSLGALFTGSFYCTKYGYFAYYATSTMAFLFSSIVAA